MLVCSSGINIIFLYALSGIRFLFYVYVFFHPNQSDKNGDYPKRRIREVFPFSILALDSGVIAMVVGCFNVQGEKNFFKCSSHRKVKLICCLLQRYNYSRNYLIKMIVNLQNRTGEV